MKFILLVYNDPSLLDALPTDEFNTRMRGCLSHADELKQDGRLIESQMLQPAKTARTLRVRNDRQSIVDGPFAETKELLAGFNIIEAKDIDEATRMAMEFPWAKTGCIEVRPILEMDSMRERVGFTASVAT
jgi:hypothetical protein